MTLGSYESDWGCMSELVGCELDWAGSDSVAVSQTGQPDALIVYAADYLIN